MNRIKILKKIIGLLLFTSVVQVLIGGYLCLHHQVCIGLILVSIGVVTVLICGEVVEREDI